MILSTRKLIRIISRRYSFVWKPNLFSTQRNVFHSRCLTHQRVLYNFRRTEQLTVEGDPNYLKVEHIDENFRPSIDKNINFHSSYLQELCRHGHLDAAMSWLNKIVYKENAKALQQKLPILFQKLFYGYFARGATEKVIALHHLMKQRDIQPNESIYSMLIKTYCIHPETSQSAIDLYHEMKVKGIEPHAREYLALISAISEYGNLDSAWDIFKKINRYPLLYDESSMSAFAALCKVMSKDEEWLKKLRIFLQFLQNNNLIPSDELLSVVKDLFMCSSGNTWTAKFTDTDIVKGTLICTSCGTHLDKTHKPTDVDHENFKQWLIKIAHLPVDMQSSEKEKNLNRILLDKLNRLLENRGPFDVVVDGLNIGFKRVNGKRVFDPNAVKLVVKHFLEQKKKVLVVGAGPMKHALLKKPELASNPHAKSIRDLLIYLTSTPFVSGFLINKSEIDDFFIIYAAAVSSTNTILLTNDTLGNHLEVMERYPRLNMVKWIKTHQAKVYFTDDGDLHVKEPSPFIHSVLIDEDSFHLPSSDEKKWLCVHKRSK